MRILISANAPWAGSAYAKMGKYLTKNLKELGHTVGYAANWGLQGGILELEEYEIYPLGVGSWGNDIIGDHAKRFKADLVISIMDLFVLEDWGQILPGKWAPWFPLDGVAGNPADFNKLQSALIGISYSKHGAEQYKKMGCEHIEYIPPGVNTSIFKPLKSTESFKEIKAMAKQSLGLDPSMYMAVMIAANSSYPDRKCFSEQIEAFSRFHKRHPNSLLYIHAWTSSQFRGVDLASICDLLDAKKFVKFPVNYDYHLSYTEERLAMILNAADVYLGAHGSEGFGLPFIEAMACGTPAILAEGTTGPELNASGWMVPAHHKIWYPLGTWHFRPDIDVIDEKLEESFNADREELGRKVLKFAQKFDWSVIRDEYWKPLLDKLEPHKPVFDLPTFPTITLASLIGPSQENLDRFIKAVKGISYPEGKLKYCFVCHPKSLAKMKKAFPSATVVKESGAEGRSGISMKTRLEIFFNQMLDEMREGEAFPDYVLYTDADIIFFEPTVLTDLVSAKAGVIAPMVFYEQGGEAWFYDIVGFIKDKKHFINKPPFFDGYRWHGEPVKMNTVGTCALIKGDILKDFSLRFTGLTGFEPICRKAKQMGYPVLMSQYQTVLHGTLRNPHTLKDWD